VLVAAWAILLFAVQEYTTGSNYPLPAVKAVGSRVVRFLLDVLACGTFVLLLRGWHLYVALVGCTLSASVLVVYYEYFGRALTWTTITNYFSEGLSVGAYALYLLRWQSFSLIVLAALILLVLVRWMRRHPIPRRQRVTICASCAAGYVLMAIASTQQIDAIRKLRTFATVDRLAMTNGYLLTWYGEWRYLDGEVLLAQALEAAKIRHDRLTPVEVGVPLDDKVVIIQVESLEFDILEFDVGGQPAMPFLRDMSRRSMLYRITPVHESGSCDADFAMLMNLYPGRDVTPYAVPKFDFSRSIAAHAREAGYRSVFFHGNDRSFFDRGMAIDRMGFDLAMFREDLESRYGLTSSHWGISDRDLLSVSSGLLNNDPDPTLHFIITLTSHGPYHFLDPEERELFPRATNVREHYLNSMRFVDTQLRTYIGELPRGTLVILYGDHASHVDYGQGPFAKGREHVPFLVHKLGSDLAPLQVTRGREIAVSGDLTTLDAAGYVWSLFRARGSEGLERPTVPTGSPSP
jgi:hypothetical protein